MDWLIESFHLRRTTLGEPDAVDPQCKVDDLPASEHLAGACERAEPSGDVQSAAPVAAFDGHRLAGVEPNPDRERKARIGDRLFDEPLLKGDGAADGRARRTEDDQRFVTAKLEHVAPVSLDHGACHLGEAPCEASGVLVPPFLREGRVAADIGDQERVDIGVAVVSVRDRGALATRPPAAARHPEGLPPAEYGPRFELDATEGEPK